ncbi:MAG: MBL fold metallo-hydrolase [Nannocystaceae bacterium]
MPRRSSSSPRLGRLALGLLLAAAPLGASAGCRGSAADAPAAAADGQWRRLAADPRIGVYTSSGWGFATASYWIEGEDGVVVIDTQFLPSAAAELLDAAREATGKEVRAAIVLHANPDKFNGTEVFQERGIEVLTSDQVLALIPAIHEKRTRAFLERYAPDYPTEEPAPTSFGDASTTLRFGDVAVEAHVLGPGCSGAHVVVTFDGHAFVGDLVANGAHSWLELGLTEQWHARLREIAAMEPRHIHPGRGASGGPELLAREHAYLERVTERVAAERARLVVDGVEPPRAEVAAALDRVKEALVAEYEGYRYAIFLEIGLPAEWRRQAAAVESSP